MGDVERRSWDVAGRAAGNSVAPGVAALAAIAGIPPETAVVAGSFVGALTEEAVDIAEQVLRRRRNRISELGERISAANESSLEAVLNEARGNPRKLELLAQVAEAASHSFDGWKIDLLANLYVRSGSSEDTIDNALLVLEVVRRLEKLHIELLKRIAAGEPIHLEPHTSMGASDRYLTTSAIVNSFDYLVEHLRSLGLVYAVEPRQLLYIKGHQNWFWALTNFGKACVQLLDARGEYLIRVDPNSPEFKDYQRWTLEDFDPRD